MKGLIIYCALAISLAMSERVLRPLQDKEGPMAALVIAPGAFLQFSQYRALAEGVQRSSQMRLWCYLADLPLADDLDPLLMQQSMLGTGKVQLVAAGMPEDTPVFGAGHSLGGTLLQVDVLENPPVAEGLILMGGNLYLTPDTFAVPTMTLTGDLDGVFRLTTAADYFRLLKNSVEGGGDVYKSLYTYKIISGLNHGQYATGNMPANVADRDIPAELSDDAARGQVAQAISVFLEYLMTRDVTTKDILESWYNNALQTFQPLYDMFNLEEEDGSRSSWINEAQSILANLPESEAHLLSVSNMVVSKDNLSLYSPSVEVDENGKINVAAVVTVTRGDFDARPRPPNSAEMLEAKMISGEGIRSASGDSSPKRQHVTCRELNMAAWEKALTAMPEVTKERWFRTGTQVSFLPDEEVVDDAEWLESELELIYISGKLEIQSSAVQSGEGDFQFCKLLSPARALEYMYIDGLRDAS